jgi:hypothetical protein
MAIINELPGIHSGSGGFLRQSVKILHDEDSLRLRHAIWEMELPSSLLSVQPTLRSFLERRSPIESLLAENSPSSNLAKLWVSQGCVTYDSSRIEYSLNEIGYFVRALSAQWYGIYYSHPFWARLSACELAMSQLFAWILRTYHLSRSVAATAARGALSGDNLKAQTIFLKNLLEEYDHCEVHYLPQHERFGLSKASVQELLPLPSSTAFDHQMGRIAKEDWLAHGIVAYFQEYTSAFRENAFALYDRIECNYELHGFFDSWKRHVGYDLDNNHSNDFESLFSGEECLPLGHVIDSLEAAATAVEYLLGSLNELNAIGQEVDIRTYRSVPSLLKHGGMATSVLGGIGDLSPILACDTHLEIGKMIAHLTFNASSPEECSAIEDLARSVLNGTGLRDDILHALSYAFEHAALITLGRLLEESDKRNKDLAVCTSPVNARSRQAVQNFFRELSVTPSDFLLTVLLALLIGTRSSQAHSQNGLLHAMRDVLVNGNLKILEPLRSARIGLQFAELLKDGANNWKGIPQQDVLCSEPPKPTPLNVDLKA